MTMLEITISVAILVVIATMLWVTLAGTVEFQNTLEQTDTTTRAARLVLSTLRRDLQLAFLTDQRQAINTYETVFVGLDENPDKLYFATMAHQRLYANSRECDQAEVTVWVADGPAEKGPGDVLFHRESERVDEEPAEGGKVHPLAFNVRTFNVRYFDGKVGEWREDWDSRNADTANRLPRAIEIGLELIGVDNEDPDDTKDYAYVSTFLLDYADRIPQGLFGLSQSAIQDAAGGGAAGGANGANGGAAGGGRPGGAAGGGRPGGAAGGGGRPGGGGR